MKSLTRFGDVSGANCRGKPRLKQNAHACIIISKKSCQKSNIADSLLDVLQTAATYGFLMLVDAAKLVERLLKPLEVPQNLSHRPDCIDFSSYDLIPSEHLGEFVALGYCI